MDSEKNPLPLPDNFDPEVNLPGREENGKVFHATIPGMNLAAQLIENGFPAGVVNVPLQISPVRFAATKFSDRLYPC